MGRFKAPFTSPRFLRQYFLRSLPHAAVGGTTPPTSYPDTGETVILHDTCSGIAAQITGRVPDTVQPGSSTWTWVNGRTAIQTDGAGKFTTFNTGFFSAGIDTTVTTGTTITLKATIQKAVYIYVRMNGQSSSDYFRLYIASDSSTNDCAVQKRTGGGGAGTVAGSIKTANIPNGTEVDVKITNNSGSIDFEVTGYYTHTVTDSDHNTNQWVGCEDVFSADAVLFDDWKVVQ